MRTEDYFAICEAEADAAEGRDGMDDFTKAWEVLQQAQQRVLAAHHEVRRALSDLLGVVGGTYGYLGALPAEMRPDAAWLKPLDEAMNRARAILARG